MNSGDVVRTLVLVLGVSGAGKNVALGALEDAGFTVINNLPASLVVNAVEKISASSPQPIAISVNAQQADFEPSFAEAIKQLVQPKKPGGAQFSVHLLRLDADDATLTKRFAETRRKHPFASDANTLIEAITEERTRIERVAGDAFLIDTSATSAHVLRLRVREFARTLTQSDGNPTIVVSSFAYRNGIPADADLVFDARILPNPYYADGLASLTGRDAPVIKFLEALPETVLAIGALTQYLDATLPAFQKDNRSRVHVAIGCTGGQHRSVYIADRIASHLQPYWRVQRHDREHPKADK